MSQLRYLNKQLKKAAAGVRYSNVSFVELRDRFFYDHGIDTLPLILPRYLLIEWAHFAQSMNNGNVEAMPRDRIQYERMAWQASRKWRAPHFLDLFRRV